MFTRPKRLPMNLPSRPHMAVDTIDGALNLYEADYRIFLDVTQEDIDSAICGDPKHCVAAQSASRMYGALAVDFHRTIAYIIWPQGKGPYKSLPKEYAVRYTMPGETMKQVADFDAQKEMHPCQMDLQAVTEGRTLRARRTAQRKWRENNNPKKIQPKSTAGPRGGHRYVLGFIGRREDDVEAA